METASLNRTAVDSIRDSERIDWRFKGMPSELFGTTIAEAAGRRLNLFTDGFLSPLVVLERAALDHNLHTMAEWCERHGVALAPHGKTPMAPQLLAEQLDAGAWGITAATASQLRVYRAFGVSRVLMANELVDAAALRWLAAELDADPGFEFACWADSVRGVELMTSALAQRSPSRPVDVMIELGAIGGRSGVRDTETALAVADAVAASPQLRLVGVAGYEGALTHGTDSTALSTVDSFLRWLRDIVVRLASNGHFEGLTRVIASAGGSAYFDQVAEVLTKPWPDGLLVLPVLRSGAYLTHDDGFYRTISPFGRHEGATPFRPALRAWAQVISRPEPKLALLCAGKRDLSFDEGLPEAQLVRRADGSTVSLAGSRVTKVMDQHAFVALGGDDRLEVGDWVGLGLSHPCTVFDKWQLLPVVNGDIVIDFVRTYF